MMKVSIVGLGSLGGFLAARLSSFPDIQIQWVYRKSSIRQDEQVLLTYPETDEPLIGQAHATSYGLEQVTGDVVFITTKAHDNSALFSQAKAWTNKTIVLLQNGIGEDEKLAQALDSSNAIISAITHLKASYTTAPYQVTLHNQLLDCVYAVHKGQANPYLDSILSHAFDEVKRETSTYHARLPKLMISFAANAASFIFDSDMYGLSNNAKCRELMLEVEQEFLALFDALSIPHPRLTISELISLLDSPSYKDAYFSMKEDFDSGKQVEFEAIFQATRSLAALHHVSFTRGSQVCHTLENLLRK
ncbi:ketopantoate reductase family protein [Vibrio coralliilyticus]|uniref:ketopantoate reductase family protein n=1 Tax=Vibrio coralliilyticus TaxID=190893 RepID=UPI001797F3AD|nr:ketopantoate reductase family protein [Vibrio coralliilyticus]NUW70039.1 ketopantoate reductase family protein [Vibrio coralliilyticus]